MSDEAFKQHGAVSWVELMTTDVEAAKNFYSKLFDWQMAYEPDLKAMQLEQDDNYRHFHPVFTDYLHSDVFHRMTTAGVVSTLSSSCCAQMTPHDSRHRKSQCSSE